MELLDTSDSGARTKNVGIKKTILTVETHPDEDMDSLFVKNGE